MTTFTQSTFKHSQMLYMLGKMLGMNMFTFCEVASAGIGDPAWHVVYVTGKKAKVIKYQDSISPYGAFTATTGYKVIQAFADGSTIGVSNSYPDNWSVDQGEIDLWYGTANDDRTNQPKTGGGTLQASGSTNARIGWLCVKNSIATSKVQRFFKAWANDNPHYSRDPSGDPLHLNDFSHIHQNWDYGFEGRRRYFRKHYKRLERKNPLKYKKTQSY